MPIRLLTAATMALLVLAGCGSFRLHDPGRMQTASEAVKLAAELSRGTTGPFGPMEQNLDAVHATQTQLRRLTEEHERETFARILARLPVDGVADRLIKATAARQEVFEALLAGERATVVAVNAALDRQQLIAAALKDTPETKEAGNLLKALGRVGKRLEWLDGLRDGLAGLHERASPKKPAAASGAVGRAVADGGPGVAADDKALAKVLAAAQDVLQGVEDDERVSAAMQLVRRAAEQTAATEQLRLLEIRRHLGDIHRLRERLAVRDVIAVCELVAPAVAQVHPAASASRQAELGKLLQQLQASGRYTDCAAALAVAGERNADVVRRWQGGTLTQYVAADLADHKQKPLALRETTVPTAPRLVAALGILLFHEGPVLSEARLDLERARHRHSIRLSALNAQQRADLVHQLSEGLDVYHRGGIKPEVVAELIMMGAQVGALGFIGAKQ